MTITETANNDLPEQEAVPGAAEKEPEENNHVDEEDVPGTEEDDDDVTVIFLDNAENGADMMSWMDRAGPEMEARRRQVLLRELRRVQRASFIHFSLLCLVPTVLLLVVIATVFGGEEECHSDVTFCELEPRSFVTAFTTRCICDSIPVQRQD